MGARALLIIRDLVSGKRDVLYRHWASPQFQVQYMAQYVRAMLEAHRPINHSTLRDWIDENPDTIPAEEWNHTSYGKNQDDLADPIDHDFRYLMQMEYPRWRFVVLAQDRSSKKQLWHLEFDASTPRVLYVAAEKMARELAAAYRRESMPADARQETIEHFTTEATLFSQWADEESEKTMKDLRFPPHH